MSSILERIKDALDDIADDLDDDALKEPLHGFHCSLGL